MKFLRPVFIFLFIFFNLFLPVYSQTTERQKPKIKDFGSSLKRQPEENLASQIAKKNEDPDGDIIRININLAVIDFMVLDEKGRSITGLKQDDFVITEKDQPQEIQTFALGDDAKIPRSIVLIIDYSASQFLYIEKSIEAAKLLVDKLRPNDLMAIVTDDVELISQFTSDKVNLKKILDSLKKKALSRHFGKSIQFSSLYAVLNEMFDEEDVRPIILFQTDGDQLFNLKEGIGTLASQIFYQKGLTSSLAKPSSNFSLNDLENKIERTRATIYTIVPGFPPKIKLEENNPNSLYVKVFGNYNYDPPSDLESKETILKDLVKQHFPNGFPDQQQTMSDLSNLSGGWLSLLEKPEDADGVYTRILSEINARYIIGFSPTNEVKDGKRRRVKIEVKNHPEYTIWGRQSYLAPLPD
jgi:VWFA-related protein